MDLHICKAVQNAVDTVQQVLGLEKQTIEYLRRYQYGDELIKKIAAHINKV